MLLLPPPTPTGIEIRAACVPEIKMRTRRERIVADESHIQQDEADFRAALADGTARQLVLPSDISADVKEDMVWLYENRLMKRWGRPFRASIMALTAGDCAFCHIAKAKTLDHSIPKSVHPRLAVEPMNLVPACRDCNMNRGVGSSKCSVSPYADRWIEEVPWLQARVPDATYPEQLHFFIAPDVPITDEQREALEEFFGDADLGPRYALLASKAFPLSSRRIRRVPHGSIVEFAQEILAEQVSDALDELGLNRWETAAYRAWLDAAPAIDWLRAPDLES